jgi:hypothetical protein
MGTDVRLVSSNNLADILESSLMMGRPKSGPSGRTTPFPGVLIPRALVSSFQGLQALSARPMSHPEVNPVALISFEPRVM